MSTMSPEPTPAPSARRGWPWILAGSILIVIVVTVATLVVAFVVMMTRPVPEFPSLVQSPDATLHGTVAYFDDQTMCVRVIAASGQNAKDVYCIPGQPQASAVKEGKNVGANLYWRADDRLEVTLYRMTDGGPDPVFTPAWQKVFDVVTGAMEETPLEDIPTAPATNEHPTRTPGGAVIETTSEDGHAVITLTDSAGTRTLLDVSGPPETYSVSQAYWAPNFEWIIANDNRVLVLTPNSPAVTRILVPPMTSFYGYDALSRFAVTKTDLLTQ